MSVGCITRYSSRERRFSHPTAREWLFFLVQIVLVSMIELGNDIIRGNFWRPNAAEALDNAHRVVAFVSNTIQERPN